ncbi:MAG TPA: T9SS type A sorting domain-containing protein, partial [Flavisolibacter sp.]|nr:T9SS type A sorting domain-containing protein [Flavisolibacter sp.]
KDGRQWTDISNITAATNSSSEKLYSYLHRTPFAGTNIYRILQRDRDGRHDISAIRTVDFDNKNISFTVYPTIIYDGKLKMQVYLPQTIYLFNADGRQLLQKHFESGEQVIDISPFSKGVYFLKGERSSEKIIIR